MRSKLVILAWASLLAASVQAAVTVEDAYAFGEDKTFEIKSGTVTGDAASIATSPTLPTGVSCETDFYACAASKTGECFQSEDLTSPDAGTTWTHIGFWIAINDPDTTVITNFQFLEFGPGKGNQDIALGLSSTGGGTEHNLHIFRANGSNACSVADHFEDETWYWLDLYYKRSDSGYAYLYSTDVGSDTRDLLCSNVFGDYNDGTSASHYVSLTTQAHGGTPFGGSSTMYWKNLIIEYGITTVPTDGTHRVSSCMMVPYHSGTTSDVGGNLSSGDWANIGDLSLVTKGSCATACSGGIYVNDDTSHGVAGPSGLFGDAVTHLGHKWTARVQRPKTASGSVGIAYGKWDGSTATWTDDTTTTACTSGAGCNLQIFEAAGGTYAPDLDEWTINGFRNALLLGTASVLEARSWTFTSFPYDEEAASMTDRVPMRGQNRAERLDR